MVVASLGSYTYRSFCQRWAKIANESQHLASPPTNILFLLLEVQAQVKTL